MVYECEKCGAALPAGALACPKCADKFDEAVPQDAEVPKRGWQPKMGASNSSSATAEAKPSASPPVDATEAHPDKSSPDNQDHIHNPDRVYGQSKASQFRGLAEAAWATPLGRKFKQNPYLLVFVIACFVVTWGIITSVWTHTNAYVFDQHPSYQAFMAPLCSPPAGSMLGQMGAEIVWPYEGHQDRLQCNLHSNGSGSDPSTPLTKADLDQEAITIRAIFCVIRYHAGFSPDDAMQCQVYVSYPNVSDTGYDGPDVAPNRDANIKGRLGQLQLDQL